MPKVYVASSLLNSERVKHFISLFKSNNVEISYDWTTHGRVHTDEELKQYCAKEFEGVVECDLLFMVFPARYGSHVELGIALALNKPVVILLEGDVEMKTFYHHKLVRLFRDQDEAFNHVLKVLR